MTISAIKARLIDHARTVLTIFEIPDSMVMVGRFLMVLRSLYFVMSPGRGVSLFKSGWPAANAVAKLVSFRNAIVAASFSVFVWFILWVCCWCCWCLCGRCKGLIFYI